MSEKQEKYQSMLKKVEKIIMDVENPNIELDQLVEKVEEGGKLIKEMQTRLSETEQKLNDVTGV